MAKITLWFGLGLMALGIVGYIGSGAESFTALIPAVLGLVLAVLGVVGAQESRRMMAMHIAVLVAVIGILGSVGGLTSLPDLLSGNDLERPWAVGVQSIMAIVLVVYVVLGVRSFIAARRARVG
jgi:FtsH-binding integral membrane protein